MDEFEESVNVVEVLEESKENDEMGQESSFSSEATTIKLGSEYNEE